MREIVYPLVTHDPCSDDAAHVFHTSSQDLSWRGMMADTRSEDVYSLGCHTGSLMEKKDVQHACTESSLSISS